jgi:hypothetical protein
VAEARHPAPFELWEQAEGDAKEYRKLMIEHGHLIRGVAQPLPCGWPRDLAAARPEPCIHEMDPAFCAVCNGAQKRAKADRPELGRWFAARFNGTCSGCEIEIRSGDEIRSDGDDGWLCTHCGDMP